ncbi:hypothetical protein GIB67_007811 [Kingdonia uniflora]|uniref:DUF7722 domain-containing protein n=1 Tax=Kingdonia uniflora TaxID=39325 RepID=A0A7J7N2A9_9MAGN|nr:hypothetical protein GIB67_007811 [Kingdonia uniflora]
MPLHYPRYTKKDYEEMPEWKLNSLLTEYGLSTHGDLAYKRDFAIGTFLWPNVNLYTDRSARFNPSFGACPLGGQVFE